jgi:hypothetical protein
LIEGSRVGISAKSDKKQQMLEGEDEWTTQKDEWGRGLILSV